MLCRALPRPRRQGFADSRRAGREINGGPSDSSDCFSVPLSEVLDERLWKPFSIWHNIYCHLHDRWDAKRLEPKSDTFRAWSFEPKGSGEASLFAPLTALVSVFIIWFVLSAFACPKLLTLFGVAAAGLTVSALLLVVYCAV